MSKLKFKWNCTGIEDLRDAMSEVEDYVDVLENDNEELEKKCEKYEVQIDNLEAENESLQETVRALQKELDSQ